MDSRTVFLFDHRSPFASGLVEHLARHNLATRRLHVLEDFLHTVETAPPGPRAWILNVDFVHYHWMKAQGFLPDLTWLAGATLFAIVPDDRIARLLRPLAGESLQIVGGNVSIATLAREIAAVYDGPVEPAAPLPAPQALTLSVDLATLLEALYLLGFTGTIPLRCGADVAVLHLEDGALGDIHYQDRSREEALVALAGHESVMLITEEIEDAVEAIREQLGMEIDGDSADTRAVLISIFSAMLRDAGGSEGDGGEAVARVFGTPPVVSIDGVQMVYNPAGAHPLHLLGHLENHHISEILARFEQVYNQLHGRTGGGGFSHFVANLDHLEHFFARMVTLPRSTVRTRGERTPDRAVPHP